MDFDFSPEQYALRDAARELFEKESSPARLRALWNGAERDERLWRQMAEMGILGILIPEEHGGTGGDEVDLALVLEEAGRAAAAEPILETVAVAAPALAEGAYESGRREWLPAIASGDAIAAVLLAGQRFAVDADVARFVLAEEDGGFRIHPRASYEVRAVTGEDRARRLFEIQQILEYREPPSRDSIRATERARERAAWASACVLNGVSMRLLEMTIEHVKARSQFGRPVGSFQAVKHRLVDVFVALESARAASWYAAYAIARDLPDRAEAASVAKASAGEAGALANSWALQCHGGIGFTWEHDLHLWLKRGKALEQAYGSAREHRARLAVVAFGEQAPGG